MYVCANVQLIWTVWVTPEHIYMCMCWLCAINVNNMWITSEWIWLVKYVQLIWMKCNTWVYMLKLMWTVCDTWIYVMKSVNCDTCWKICNYCGHEKWWLLHVQQDVSWIILQCMSHVQSVNKQTERWYTGKDSKFRWLLSVICSVLHCIWLKGLLTVYSSHWNSDVGGIVLRGSITEIYSDSDSESGIDLWIRVSTHRNTWKGTYGSYIWFGWRAIITDSVPRGSELEYAVAAIINRSSIRCMMCTTLDQCDITCLVYVIQYASCCCVE